MSVGNVNTPTVSVVMGVYNDAPFLKMCLDRLVNQTYNNLEIIIIDDASRDNSREIIKGFAAKDSRIKFIRHNNNVGLTETLIEGCNLASGEYIARQDADDYSFKTRIADQVAILNKHDDVGVVGSSFQLVGPRDEVLVPRIDNDSHRMNSIWQEAKEIAINPHHGSTLYRKYLYDIVGGYRSPFKVAQDCDLWWRMMEHTSFYSVEQPLYTSRYHISSITAKSRNLQQKLAEYALQLTKVRRAGEDETPLLAEVMELSNMQYKGVDITDGEAESLYFVTACLNNNDDPQALHYAKRALVKRPVTPRYIYQFMRALKNKALGDKSD